MPRSVSEIEKKNRNPSKKPLFLKLFQWARRMELQEPYRKIKAQGQKSSLQVRKTPESYNSCRGILQIAPFYTKKARLSNLLKNFIKSLKSFRSKSENDN